MKEALLGICAGKFNIVLTFVRFVLISLEIYSVPQPTQAVPFNSNQNPSSALAVRLPCCGLSLTSLALLWIQGKMPQKKGIAGTWVSTHSGFSSPFNYLEGYECISTPLFRNDKTRNGEIKRKCSGTCLKKMQMSCKSCYWRLRWLN